MESYKKRLHLDRSEILILCGLVVLLTGLTFTLGVMVGYGIHPLESAEVALSPSAHEILASSENPSHAQRKPASLTGATPLPGSELRKAFQESKQKALVDMVLRAPGSQQPKSIVDESAHFESHPWSSRDPAGSMDEEKPVASSSLPPSKVKTKQAGIPQSVKGLFERAPSSVEHFSPASGSYTVQIASFPSEDESASKVSELRKSGFNEAYVEKTSWNGETWFRVGVGSFPSGDWARKTGEKLVRRHLANDFVVRQVN